MPNGIDRSRMRWIIVNLLCLWPLVSHAEVLWIEGESPTTSTMHRHPWWYDKVKRDQLSGGTGVHYCAIAHGMAGVLNAACGAPSRGIRITPPCAWPRTWPWRSFSTLTLTKPDAARLGGLMTSVL